MTQKSKPPCQAVFFCRDALQRLCSRGFQQTLFQLLLARDAVARPRHSLESLGVDLFPARDALAECTFANPVQGTVDHCQNLTLAAALAKKKLFGIRLRRPVSHILRRFEISFASILRCAAHVVPQFPLALFQPFFKCVQLFFLHGSRSTPAARNMHRAKISAWRIKDDMPHANRRQLAASIFLPGSISLPRWNWFHKWLFPQPIFPRRIA